MKQRKRRKRWEEVEKRGEVVVCTVTIMYFWVGKRAVSLHCLNKITLSFSLLNSSLRTVSLSVCAAVARNRLSLTRGLVDGCLADSPGVEHDGGPDVGR